MLEAAQRTVGNFLRSAREAQHLTQAEVAERTRESTWQLSRAAVSAIERGQNFPGLEAMLALSNVLHIDPKELIERARLTAVVPVNVTDLTDADLERRAAQYFWAGDFNRALAVYDAMVERLALESPERSTELVERLAQVEIHRATALKRAGALLSAIASAERAVFLARDRQELLAEAYIVLADLQVQRGHLPLARDDSERAIELADACGRPRLQAWAWMVHAAALFLAREPDPAREAFERARAYAEAANDTAHLTHIEGNIGQCWLAAGRLAEARRTLERAVRLARQGQQPHLEASFTVELGKIALEEDRFEDARRLARSALGIGEPRHHKLTVFRAEWLLHKLKRRNRPQDRDRSRLDRLHELFLELDQHEGVEEIREFRLKVPRGAGATGG